MMTVPFHYIGRNLLVRKSRTLTACIGIALVVFILASSLMLANGLEHTLVSSGRADSAIVLRKGSETELASSFPQRNLGLIEVAPGVSLDGESSPLVTGDAVVVMTLEKQETAGEVAHVQVRGVSANTRSLRTDVKIVDGRMLAAGTSEAIVGAGVVDRFEGLRLNGTIEVGRNHPVKVVGVFEASGSAFESEIWTDIETVRGAFGREALYSSATIKLQSQESFTQFKAAVEKDKRMGLEALRERDYYEKQSQGTSLFLLSLGGTIAFLFSIAAMMGATITMQGSVAERTREIGTLLALGFSRASVLLAFVLESILLASVGGALGTAAALGLSFHEFHLLNFQTWQEIHFSFEPSLSIVVGSFLAAGFMGLVGGAAPALRAARVSPMKAMRA